MSGPVLELRVATLAQIEAALAGPEPLGRELGGAVAEDWERFPGALPFVRDALASSPSGDPWGTRLFLLREPATLVGWGGFKGAPQERTVELGYSIAPEFEGRGLATAATALMLEEAAASGAVDVVTARTMPEPGPSTRVLEKAGFERDAAPVFEDGRPVWGWRYILPR